MFTREVFFFFFFFFAASPKDRGATAAVVDGGLLFRHRGDWSNHLRGKDASGKCQDWVYNNHQTNLSFFFLKIVCSISITFVNFNVYLKGFLFHWNWWFEPSYTVPPCLPALSRSVISTPRTDSRQLHSSKRLFDYHFVLAGYVLKTGLDRLSKTNMRTNSFLDSSDSSGPWIWNVRQTIARQLSLNPIDRWCNLFALTVNVSKHPSLDLLACVIIILFSHLYPGTTNSSQQQILFCWFVVLKRF